MGSNTSGWDMDCDHGEEHFSEIARIFGELKTEVNRSKPDNYNISRCVNLLRSSYPYCEQCSGNYVESVGYQDSYCAEYLFNALNHYKTPARNAAGTELKSTALWQTYVVDGLKMLKTVTREQDWNSMFKQIKTISLVVACSYYHHSNKGNPVKSGTELISYLLAEGLDSNTPCDAKLSPRELAVRKFTTTCDDIDDSHRLFEKLLTSTAGISLASQFVKFGADLNAQILISLDKNGPTLVFDSFWDYLNLKVNEASNQNYSSKSSMAKVSEYFKSVAKEKKNLIFALIDRRASRMQWTKLIELFGYQDHLGTNVKVCTSTYEIHPLFSLVGVMDIVTDYSDKSWKRDDVKTTAAHKSLICQTTTQ